MWAQVLGGQRGPVRVCLLCCSVVQPAWTSRDTRLVCDEGNQAGTVLQRASAISRHEPCCQCALA